MTAPHDPNLTALQRGLSRRTLLQASGLGAAGLAVAACGGAGGGGGDNGDGGGDSDSLSWSNWPAYIDVDDDGAYPTLEAFQEETGITVKYTEDVNDNEEFYAKVRPQLEQGTSIGRDIVVLTDWMAARWIRLGYTEQFTAGSIPNKANVLPSLANVAFDPGRENTLPWQSGFAGLGWNAPLLKEALGTDSLTSLEQLWDPKLKGRVSVLSEMRDTIGVIMLAQGKNPADFTADDFEAANAELAKQIDSGQIRQVSGNDYLGALENGDVVAVIGWSGDVIGAGRGLRLRAARVRGDAVDRQLHDPQGRRAQGRRREAARLLLRPGQRRARRRVRQLPVPGAGRAGRDGEDRPGARRQPLDLPGRRHPRQRDGVQDPDRRRGGRVQRGLPEDHRQLAHFGGGGNPPPPIRPAESPHPEPKGRPCPAAHPPLASAASRSRTSTSIQLTKRFAAMTAVDDLTLTIPAGSFFALLGPSGCGKTTTLRMVAGLEDPTAGRIRVGEQDITLKRPYQRPVNTVFQSYALFPHLDIYENVAFGLRRQRRKDVDAVVQAMLELVELTPMARRKPAQLSGGQQQRVAVARALVNQPDVLLLDEPLGALDLKLRRQMQIELKRIQTEVGITFVHVTHDQEEAMTMADTVAVMNQGRIEQMGAPQDIYDRPQTAFVANFLGRSNLLEGRVTGRDGDVLIVEVHGRRMALPVDRAASDTGSVVLGVRPEKLHLTMAHGESASGGLNAARGGRHGCVLHRGVAPSTSCGPSGARSWSASSRTCRRASGPAPATGCRCRGTPATPSGSTATRT